MRITSTHNELVKYVRSLSRVHTRRMEQAYLVEGARLLREAIGTRQEPVLILYDPDALGRSTAGRDLLTDLLQWSSQAHEVAAHVLSSAAQTETPAGALAVIRQKPVAPLERHIDARFGLVLDGLSDPGNVGAILRTADAAALDFVALTPGSADPFNPKSVRAGMGAHFRLPIYPGIPWSELSESLPQTTWIGVEAEASASLYSASWPEHGGLVVGGEAHGLPQETRRHLHHSVRIPMRQGVESLNAAVAASIAIYAAMGPYLSVVL